MTDFDLNEPDPEDLTDEQLRDWLNLVTRSQRRYETEISIAETVEHMQWHRDQGDMVPSRLLDPVTYDEHDFIAMCMTYLCREDEGHAGAHTPVRTERDQQVRDNSEVRHLEAMMRGRKFP